MTSSASSGTNVEYEISRLIDFAACGYERRQGQQATESAQCCPRSACSYPKVVLGKHAISMVQLFFFPLPQ